MKKFFKALALVLALTLIFGTIPASAAVNPDNVKKEKTLYVNGTKGFKTVDGEAVASKYQARTTYWKLLGIKKAEAKKLGVTATSAAPEIIKTNDETMGVRAYAIGGSKDKPIVITLSDGTNLYKVNMIAKKSATTIAFNRELSEDKEFSTNTAYELSMPRSVSGEKLDTDERRLIIKNADGNVVYSETEANKEAVEVAPDATAPRLWTVKFLKAGTYTIIGQAFQSKKYNGTVVEKSFDVVVKTPELVDIKQTATNAFQLIFNGDAAAIDFKPQEIYYKVDGNVVPFSLLKETKVNADDATKVDVTMHMDFKGGETYYVKVGEVTLFFKACGTSAKDITKLVITTEKVEYGDLRAIDYKYYNDDMIDISGPNSDLYPTFEITSSNTSDAFISSQNIYFFEKDKTVSIKGTVTTDYGNEANGYQPTVVEGTAVITSTDQAQATFKDVVYTFTSNADAVKFDEAKAKDFDWAGKSVHDYKINDGTDTLNIWFRYDSADGKSIEYKSLYDAGITKVAVADENYGVILGWDDDESWAQVKGIKKIDSVPVILYVTNAAGEFEPVKTINIKIQDARKLTSATLSADKTRLNKEPGFTDTVKLTLKLADNYGDAIDADVTMTQTQVTIDNIGTLKIDGTLWDTSKTGEYTYSVTSGAFTWASKIGTDEAKQAKGGSVVVSVAAELGGVKVNSNNVGIEVANKKDAKVSYIPTLTSATLDTSIKKDTTSSSSKFYVKKTKAGYDAGTEAVVFMTGKEFSDKNKAWAADDVKYKEGAFVYTIKVGTDIIDTATNFDGVDTITAVVKSSETLAVADTTVTGSAVKAKAATYIYTLYQVTKDSKGEKQLKSIGTANLVVSDAQVLPTYTVRTDVTEAKGSVGNLVSNAAVAKQGLKVTCFGEDYTENIVAADVVKSNIESDYMNSIIVKIENANVGDLYVKVDINKLFNGTNK